MNRTLAILISGRGSNLKAIIDAIKRRDLDARIAVVISNRADARGIDHAIGAGIETLIVDHKAYATREDYDRALVYELRKRDVSLVCLAGFMRLLSPVLVDAFPGRILNIHPSLLPKFPGLHTHQQALDAGETEHGATVHFVTAQLDHGPVLGQVAVPVLPGDDAAGLAGRVLAREHPLLVATLRLLAQRRLSTGSDMQVRLDGQPLDQPLQLLDDDTFQIDPINPSAY